MVSSPAENASCRSFWGVPALHGSEGDRRRHDRGCADDDQDPLCHGLPVQRICAPQRLDGCENRSICSLRQERWMTITSGNTRFYDDGYEVVGKNRNPV